MHYKTWFSTVRSSSVACSLLLGDVPPDQVTLVTDGRQKGAVH